MAPLLSTNSLGSLGTNLRAACPIGAEDVRCTAPILPFREFVQEEKWRHPVLWQMLLALKGVNFHVHKIKIESESFPRPCSEKYFAALVFFQNKSNPQTKWKPLQLTGFGFGCWTRSLWSKKIWSWDFWFGRWQNEDVWACSSDLHKVESEQTYSKN